MHQQLIFCQNMKFLIKISVQCDDYEIQGIEIEVRIEHYLLFSFSLSIKNSVVLMSKNTTLW